MKKIKVLNILSLIFNLLIVGGVAYGVYLLANANLLMNTLMFFTIESNLLVGLAALVAVVFAIISLKKGTALPKAVNVFKLVATTAIAVTMLTVVFFIAPTNGWNIASQFGNFNIKDIQFIYHLIVPVLSIITYLFFDTGKGTKWAVNFISVIFPLLYGVFYIVNYYLHFVVVKVSTFLDLTGDTYDWYGFFAFNQLAFTILILAAILVVAFLVSFLLWLVNKKVACEKAVANKYRSSASSEPETIAPREEVKPVEEEVEEQEESEVEDKPEEESVKEEPSKEESSGENVYRVVEPEAEPAEEEAVEESPVEEEKVEEKPAEKKEEKKAPAKKAAPKKKEEAKKSTSKKEEPKKAETSKKKDADETPKDKDATKVYHLTKRKEDGMWAITFVGGKKAIKLFKTKKEAEEYLKTLTENQGATALIRNSKGSKAGKFASSIKSNKEE